MTPNDTFSYLKGQQTSYDHYTLAQCYQPILGLEAIGIYSYLLAFWDNGERSHKFSEILNHMQMGMTRFEEGLALLTAMDLVTFYQTSDRYVMQLNAALSRENFLKNPAYRRLLEKRIGEVAVKNLETAIPEGLRNLSKKFSAVFSDSGAVDLKVPTKGTFDWESFQNHIKAKELAISPDSEDVISLNNIAERYRLNWFELYQVAEETAVNRVINPKRIIAKLEQKKAKKDTSKGFTPQQLNLIKRAKEDNPFTFLAEMKKAYDAYLVTDNETNLVRDLRKNGLLDEVINIIIFYTFETTRKSNLNREFVLKVSNALHQTVSAEDAIEKLQSLRKQPQHPSAAKVTKSNVPEWSKQDYKNETTEEEQARLDDIRRKALERLGRSE